MLYSKIQARIIDVNLNRFSEGLKVIEDLARFYITEKTMLNSIREIKQKFWIAFGKTRKEVLFSRKSQQDLGRKDKFDKTKRKNLYDILIVNLKRCQESLRVLEELIKIVKPEDFGIAKQLRFELYDLEKEILVKIIKKFDMSLYVIIDIETTGRKRLTEITNACLKGGATIIQLREPENTSFKQWINDVRKVKSIINNHEIKFIINNRADVALDVQADGVHIGESDISTVDARKLLGDEKIIGVTACNSIRAQKAEKDGADYIGVGAIFPSITKPDAPVVGINQLKRVIKTVNIPIVAIGGINPQNAKQLFKLGVSGIAVISSIFKGIEAKQGDISRKIINNISKFNK